MNGNSQPIDTCKIFWFYLFLEAKAEILEKISLVFWEIWRHQKDILKLIDLYHRQRPQN